MIDGVEDDEARVVVLTEDGVEHKIVTMTNRATLSFTVPYQELLDHLDKVTQPSGQRKKGA